MKQNVCKGSRTTLFGLVSIMALCAQSHATNGMNMEGYGPISSGLGGSAQAVDHGTAAMMQNPATLSLIGGQARLDVALGLLGPKVSSRIMGMNAPSEGTSYWMPAFGYANSAGALTYGVGIFGQGGMGTEYGADSFLAVGSGLPVRSELSIGRLIAPLSFRLSPQWTLGATLDYVWGGLDLRMAATGAQLGALVTAATGNLGAALPSLGSAPWARIDFSNRNDFSGKASTSGWAGKVGVLYEHSADLRFGFSHHFKTSLRDMKTSASGATITAAGGFGDSGRISVIDFQWPSSTSVGMAWQATPSLLIATDIKTVRWSGVMKNFRMAYESSTMGGTVSFTLPQNWKDQNIINLGGAYKLNDSTTLRAGLNVASNPVPDSLLNPLFPATVEKHLMLGVGHKISSRSEVNASLTIAPAARNTNVNGVETSHRQTNAQLMYSYRH